MLCNFCDVDRLRRDETRARAVRESRLGEQVDECRVRWVGPLLHDEKCLSHSRVRVAQLRPPVPPRLSVHTLHREDERDARRAPGGRAERRRLRRPQHVRFVRRRVREREEEEERANRQHHDEHALACAQLWQAHMCLRRPQRKRPPQSSIRRNTERYRVRLRECEELWALLHFRCHAGSRAPTKNTAGT